MTADTAALRRIWKQAFGDTDEMLDTFFSTGFSKDRCHYLCENSVPVSALYWFDCTLDGQRLAYLYAVATEETHRNQGLARRLMEQTHSILQKKGYAGAILVPGSKELFSLYEKLGYRTVCEVNEFSSQWGDAPVALTEIGAQQYAQLREQYLPTGGVVQEGAAINFLQTYCRFFAGEDFLLAASIDKNTLVAQELLGNTAAAPGILRALDIPQGTFRTPGRERPFVMLLPLQKNCPKPTYFGLALD